MNIAVLSGKGGAGKTFVAVNLAAAAGQATYIDCDVEEPNGRLFWKPEQVRTTPVVTLLPEFDNTKCTGCRKCVDFCRFHALLYIRETPMVFPEVCHSCGGCLLACPQEAIREVPRQIGVVEEGTHGNIHVVTGILNPGEASGIPIIREALKKAEGLTILDCPPGSACSVMESILRADYCLLTAEPTAFGFHNFRMVYELASLLGKPVGVVINKEDQPYSPLEAFCEARAIPILAHIPYREDYGRLAAAGKILAEESPEAKAIFLSLWETLIKSARADGERFWHKRKFGKSGNTGCISHFSNCTIGAKDSPAAVDDLFSVSLWEKIGGSRP